MKRYRLKFNEQRPEDYQSFITKESYATAAQAIDCIENRIASYANWDDKKRKQFRDSCRAEEIFTP